MQSIKSLKNLDGIASSSRPGFRKHWPLKSAYKYELLHDYLQKVNFSVLDFNATIEHGFSRKNKDTVFLIATTDWINEATKSVPGCYPNHIIKNFSFSKQNELTLHRAYFSALRSFVLAHPLGTSRHERYGLDGNYICVDIRPKQHFIDICNGGFHRLTIDGLERVDKIQDHDVVLLVYSKKDGAEYFQHIGFDMTDVRDTAALCIDYLYELDRHISKLNRKDFQP